MPARIPAHLLPAELLRQYQLEKAGKPSKYRNVRTERNGAKYDSKKEADRGQFLGQLEKLGAVRDLKRQVSFVLSVNNIKITTYRADFTYTDAETGERVVEDVKGVRTQLYKVKRGLMLACLGIRIKET